MAKSKRSSFTPEQDALLSGIYARNKYGNNAQRKAAKALDMPPSAVLFRAIELGLTTVRERFRWTEEEKTILERFAHLSPERIQEKLCSISPLGIKRTRSAIVRQIHTNRLRTNLDGLNHEQLAVALGISQQTLHQYRIEGLIRAQGHLPSLNQHQGKRVEVFLAAPWFYPNEAIRRFVAVHPGLINFKAANGLWLIDLLLDGRYQHGIDGALDRQIRKQRKARKPSHIFAVHGQMPRI